MLDKPGTIVYRYWEDRPQPVVTSNPDVATIVYLRAGAGGIGSSGSATRGQDETATVKVDLKTLGLAEAAM